MNCDISSKEFAISTQVRFYRNVSDIKFASKISKDDADDINHHAAMTAEALWGDGKYTSEHLLDRFENPYIKHTDYVPLPNDKNIVRGLFTSPDGMSTILTNECEHLIISGNAEGYDIDTAYANACETVNSLSKHMPFATSDSLGFLTANPDCVGLGMTVSVLVHIPGICISPIHEKLKEKIEEFGVSMDPFYCDKKFPFGAMFYISNKYSLGLTEEEAISSVKEAMKYIIDRESDHRSWLTGSKKALTQDAVWRSLGLLACSRRLNPAEFMVNISNVRFGAETSEFNIPFETIDEIFRKGSVQYIKKYMMLHDIEPNESTDTVRARIMREEFSPILKSIL